MGTKVRIAAAVFSAAAQAFAWAAREKNMMPSWTPEAVMLASGLVMFGALWPWIRLTPKIHLRSPLFMPSPASPHPQSGRRSYPSGGDILRRIHSLEALRLLREVNIHMLEHGPATEDAGRLETLLDWWERQVVANARGAGVSENSLRNLEVLGQRFPAPSGVPRELARCLGMSAAKRQQLERIIEESEGAVAADFRSLVEEIRKFQDAGVLKSVDDIDHSRREVRIKAVARPNVTAAIEEEFRAIRGELECLGYRALGWPGDEG